MQFRNTTTGVEQQADPGTKRYDIFARSSRWVAVGSHGEEVESPYELLTVAQLKEIAANHGIEVPADARKARLVELVRDADIQLEAQEVEA